jgi:hypothetical protein
MKTSRASPAADRPARPRPRSAPSKPEPPEPVAAYCLVALLFGPGMLLWAGGLTAFTCCLGLWPCLGLAAGGGILLTSGFLVLVSLCLRPPA